MQNTNNTETHVARLAETAAANLKDLIDLMQKKQLRWQAETAAATRHITTCISELKQTRSEDVWHNDVEQCVSGLRTHYTSPWVSVISTA